MISAETNSVAGTRPYQSSVAETKFIEAPGVRYAYRILGAKGSQPLVLLNRFRGTMDHWDPALLDFLSQDRQVIIFDTAGFARSTGEPPTTMAGFADAAAVFIEALGLKQVDILGFSIGGFFALQLLLDRPELVRRLVLAGSGPGFVENTQTADKVWEVALKPVNDNDDFLFLFFKDTPTSQAAGKAYLARLDFREDAFLKQVDTRAIQGLTSASREISTPQGSLVPRLKNVTLPVLVAHGDLDIMIPTYRSYVMAQAMPNAKLVIYPDSAHGFLFQYAEDFAGEVTRFLQQET